MTCYVEEVMWSEVRYNMIPMNWPAITRSWSLPHQFPPTRRTAVGRVGTREVVEFCCIPLVCWRRRGQGWSGRLPVSSLTKRASHLLLTGTKSWCDGTWKYSIFQSVCQGHYGVQHHNVYQHQNQQTARVIHASLFAMAERHNYRGNAGFPFHILRRMVG